jgi:hypothetical protein
MERLFAAFEAQRVDEAETLLAFTRRHSIEALKVMAGVAA